MRSLWPGRIGEVVHAYSGAEVSREDQPLAAVGRGPVLVQVVRAEPQRQPVELGPSAIINSSEIF